ncbi:hypothetical protein DEO72_LG8g2522 [Vigna unguiculata]|uniref:Secreted protein n=1 Tax=Vigna unguiculata TaxID=3917 RepID=A0A4D6MSP4_VIGUN|nr:hypothetical protein DEO72_LG8g2522 [Vigna unguiculata]
MLAAKPPTVTVTTLRVLSTSALALLATTPPLRVVRNTVAPFPLLVSSSDHQNHCRLPSQPPSTTE